MSQPTKTTITWEIETERPLTDEEKGSLMLALQVQFEIVPDDFGVKLGALLGDIKERPKKSASI